MKKSRFTIHGLISLLLFALVFASVVFIPLQSVKAERVTIHSQITNTAGKAYYYKTANGPSADGADENLTILGKYPELGKFLEPEYKLKLSVFEALVNLGKAADFIKYMDADGKSGKEISDEETQILSEPEKYLSRVNEKTLDTVYFLSALFPGFIKAGGDADNNELIKSIFNIALLAIMMIFFIIVTVRFFMTAIKAILKRKDGEEFYRYAVSKSGVNIGMVYIAVMLLELINAFIGDITYTFGTAAILTAGALYIAAAYLTVGEKGYSPKGKTYMSLVINENLAQYAAASVVFAFIFKIIERIKHLNWDDERSAEKLMKIIQYNDNMFFYAIYAGVAIVLMTVGALFIASVNHISFTAEPLSELTVKNKYGQELHTSYVTKPVYPIVMTALFLASLAVLFAFGMLSVSPVPVTVCGVLYILIIVITAVFEKKAKSKAPGIDPAHYDLLFEKQSEDEPKIQPDDQ